VITITIIRPWKWWCLEVLNCKEPYFIVAWSCKSLMMVNIEFENVHNIDIKTCVCFRSFTNKILNPNNICIQYLNKICFKLHQNLLVFASKLCISQEFDQYNNRNYTQCFEIVFQLCVVSSKDIDNRIGSLSLKNILILKIDTICLVKFQR